MSDERIDFSALDPKRNARRWEALVQKSLPAPSWLSFGRVRPVVMVMAALSLLAWAPALFSRESTNDAALALVHYSHAGDLTALLESSDGY